ncbi:MAG: hypothetical protein D6805_07950 [Planctomycetota bacterium]|nr:MAG: hypothetical protein D6805_07950 [Planctomycetota bacterium]
MSDWRRWFLVLGCLLGVGNMSWLGANEYIQRGDIAFSQGDYQRARDEYRKATIEEPQNVAAHLALAHSLFALGEYTYAHVELRNGLELHSAPEKIEIDLSMQYPSRKAFEEKLERIAVVAAARPEDISVYFTYAYVCYYSGYKIRARKLFKHLLLIAKNSYSDRKWAKFYLSQLQEERILGQDEHFRKGVYALKEGRYYRSYQFFRRVRYKFPALGIPRLLMGQALFAMGYYEAAYSALNSGILFRPHNKILNSEWKYYYPSEQEVARLLLALEGHVRVNSGEIRAKRLLFLMYYFFKKFSLAQKLLPEISGKGGDYILWVVPPLLKRRMGRASSSGGSASGVHKSGPSSPGAISPSARHSESGASALPSSPSSSSESLDPQRGRERSSSSSSRKKERGEDPYFRRLRQLGQIYCQRQKYELALVAFQSMLAKDEVAYYEVSYVRFALGEYDSAGQALRQALFKTNGKRIPPLENYFHTDEKIEVERRNLERFVYENPRHLSAALFLAFLYYKLRQPALSYRVLRRILQYGQDNAAAIVLRLISPFLAKKGSSGGGGSSASKAVKRILVLGEKKYVPYRGDKVENPEEIISYRGELWRLWKGEKGKKSSEEKKSSSRKGKLDFPLKPLPAGVKFYLDKEKTLEVPLLD